MTMRKGWSLLNDDRTIVNDIASRWQTLIDSRHKELVYHDYLRRHANLFLLDNIHSYFAISKLKLGSDFEVDFAVPTEAHSKGLLWELIEIEKPQDAPYNKNGVPSAALTHSTQQVRNWRRWLQENRHYAEKLFSNRSVRTTRNPNFRFTVIIGTRKNSELWLSERNQYSVDNAIDVRSFDYLTDRLKERFFRDRSHLGSGTWEYDNMDLSRELMNPFAEALSDSQWKQLLRQPQIGSPHFMAHACEHLVQIRDCNQEALNHFQAIHNGREGDAYPA